MTIQDNLIFQISKILKRKKNHKLLLYCHHEKKEKFLPVVCQIYNSKDDKVDQQQCPLSDDRIGIRGCDKVKQSSHKCKPQAESFQHQLPTPAVFRECDLQCSRFFLHYTSSFENKHMTLTKYTILNSNLQASDAK